MNNNKSIKSVLISVFHKDNLDIIANKLNERNIIIYSTGGTQNYLDSINIKSINIECITNYPSILGGRVKTLHPKIFGGILYRRDNENDLLEIDKYEIPNIDAVVVDLYPFEKTLLSNAPDEDIIEKIDIGGVSLLRAAAKNYNDVLVIPSISYYDNLIEIIEKGYSTINERKYFATLAFAETAKYDSLIFAYFNKNEDIKSFSENISNYTELRYGENPHQKGIFYGDLNNVIEQLHGKQLSYNNLIDVDAAINLILEFSDPTFAILKHNNPCGVASDNQPKEAFVKALAGDPVSAYGGIIVTNTPINVDIANEINKIFFEVIIAPNYTEDAIDVLSQKKNRIILKLKNTNLRKKQFRSLLNGVLEQDRDMKTETIEDFKFVTNNKPSDTKEIEDLIFANKVVKNTKSNAIVIAKNKQMLGSGMGQTSRVDATKNAINKAIEFGFDLNGAVMASDAYFPFSDSIEIAYKQGIKTIIQPGGSIRDHEVIDFCNKHDIKMVFTGFRHFKH